jgi:putative lumazine-binding protein
MSAVTAENQTVAETVQLYIDGVATGDSAKLEQAFHESAWMYGAIDAQRFDEPIAEMIKLVVSQPADADGNFRGSIRTIAEEGDVAMAIVEEEGFWGTLSFVDYFSLARIAGGWKIVNKTFAHTGGSLPAS